MLAIGAVVSGVLAFKDGPAAWGKFSADGGLIFTDWVALLAEVAFGPGLMLGALVPTSAVTNVLPQPKAAKPDFGAILAAIAVLADMREKFTVLGPPVTLDLTFTFEDGSTSTIHLEAKGGTKPPTPTPVPT